MASSAAKRSVEARRQERIPISVRGSARVAVSIEVQDISTVGVRAKMSIDLPIGTLIKIGLPAERSRHARVVWSRDGLTGCEFISPLLPSELDQLVNPIV